MHGADRRATPVRSGFRQVGSGMPDHVPKPCWRHRTALRFPVVQESAERPGRGLILPAELVGRRRRPAATNTTRGHVRDGTARAPSGGKPTRRRRPRHAVSRRRWRSKRVWRLCRRAPEPLRAPTTKPCPRGGSHHCRAVSGRPSRGVAGPGPTAAGSVAAGAPRHRRRATRRHVKGRRSQGTAAPTARRPSHRGIGPPRAPPFSLSPAPDPRWDRPDRCSPACWGGP